MAVYLVIFGAAVRADGSPSGSLRRRCESALRAGRGIDRPFYLATGGEGLQGPAEAHVMRQLLIEGGVPASQVLMEAEAGDTLESVRLCTRILRARGDADELRACTSSYHLRRCVWLFRIAGFRCTGEAAPSDRPHLGTPKWLRYVAKEIVATPWDAAWMWALKMRKAI